MPDVDLSPDDPRWLDYVAGAIEQAMAILPDGYVVVPVEPNEATEPEMTVARAQQAEIDNLTLSFCNAVTRCEGAEATLSERTFERDNAVATAKEQAQAVVDAHAEIARLRQALAEAREVVTGGWPEAPEIQPASWIISAADFMEAVLRGDVEGAIGDDPESAYEAARELRQFATRASDWLTRTEGGAHDR